MGDPTLVRIGTMASLHFFYLCGAKNVGPESGNGSLMNGPCPLGQCVLPLGLSFHLVPRMDFRQQLL